MTCPKKIKSLFMVVCCLFLVSCADEPRQPKYERPPIVVEGWIEEGEPPMVFVTHAVDLTADSISFDNFVEKWGRVSIFDGETRHILTGRINKNYRPQFVFTSSRLRGEAGHSYRLPIETETDTLESVSTILPHPTIASARAVPTTDNDTLYTIQMHLNEIAPDAYYKIFARSLSTEKRFYGSFLGTFAGSSYNSNEGASVSRGLHIGTEDDNQQFSHYYSAGDRVQIKICSMERPLYDFWTVYDASVSMSDNLFVNFAGNCPSNIPGALGYWAAYGSDATVVNIQ